MLWMRLSSWLPELWVKMVDISLENGGALICFFRRLKLEAGTTPLQEQKEAARDQKIQTQPVAFLLPSFFFAYTIQSPIFIVTRFDMKPSTTPSFSCPMRLMQSKPGRSASPAASPHDDLGLALGFPRFGGDEVADMVDVHNGS